MFIVGKLVILGPEENVASAKFNSKTIRGELRSALLDGEVANYDMEKGKLFSFIFTHQKLKPQTSLKFNSFDFHFKDTLDIQ